MAEAQKADSLFYNIVIVKKINEWKVRKIPLFLEVFTHLRLAEMRSSSPLSFLQVILPILWTRGPGQMVTVTAENTPETKKLNYIDINKKFKNMDFFSELYH